MNETEEKRERVERENEIHIPSRLSLCSSLSPNLTQLVMHRGTARTDEQKWETEVTERRQGCRVFSSPTLLSALDDVHADVHSLVALVTVLESLSEEEREQKGIPTLSFKLKSTIGCGGCGTGSCGQKFNLNFNFTPPARKRAKGQRAEGRPGEGSDLVARNTMAR